jgi:hypothetical protein
MLPQTPSMSTIWTELFEKLAHILGAFKDVRLSYDVGEL